MPICSVPPSRTSVLAYRPIANSASLTGWRGSANSLSGGPAALDHDIEESARHFGGAADVGQGRIHLGHEQRPWLAQRRDLVEQVEAQVRVAAQAQERAIGRGRDALHQHVDAACGDRCARRACSSVRCRTTVPAASPASRPTAGRTPPRARWQARHRLSAPSV
jgi:hypothetical protein